MGRFVISESGNLDWEWKFWFARQCSNFGFILQEVAANGEEIYVRRYTSEDGEFVKLNADKQQLIKALSNTQLEACPVCRDKGCLEATLEMLKSFKEAVEKFEEPDIYATWFVEYY